MQCLLIKIYNFIGKNPKINTPSVFEDKCDNNEFISKQIFIYFTNCKILRHTYFDKIQNNVPIFLRFYNNSQREEAITQYQDAIDVIEHNERDEQKKQEKERARIAEEKELRVKRNYIKS